MNDTEILIQAVYAKFMATPTLLAAFPGGCHIEVAPANVSVHPYLVVETVGSPLDHAYGSATSANPTLAFKAVGLERKATAEALKVLTDLLDDPATELTSAYSHHRNGGALPIQIGPSEAGNSKDLWQWAVAYEFATQ